MKCKACKRKIDDNSIFCNWCGARQVKEEQVIKIPEPKKLASGKWNVYLRAEGQSVTEDTKEKCITKARAIRAGFLEAQKSAPKLTMAKAIERYIAENDAVLSPGTIRGYLEIGRNRFKPYHDKELSSVNWQAAINREAKLCGPKTLKNAWGLVARVMRCNHITPPDVRLPQVVPTERPWLNYEQVLRFVEELRGTPCEFAALLALHSLRRSELLAITPSKIREDGIHVSGSMVIDRDNNLVEKKANKNTASTRVVPIMIPRLQELIDASDKGPDEPYVDIRFNKLYNHINTVCRHAGLPEVGVHGLRRSFASLAYHLGWQERKTMAIGGWDDWETMHKIYIHLSSKDLSEAADSMRAFYTFTDKITDESAKP